MSKKSGARDFELHSGAGLKWMHRAGVVVVLGLAALVAWSIVAEVDEVVRARGAIEPIAQVQRVESRHGGRVVAVEAELGQYVNEGDVIVIFSRTGAEAERKEADARIAGLLLEVERLEALIGNRDADFSALSASYPLLVERERAALEAQRRSIETKRAEINSRIESTKAQIAAIEDEMPQLQIQIDAASGELETIASLVERGLAERPRLNALTEQVASLRLQSVEMNGRRATLQADLNELAAELAEVDAETVANAQSRIVDATSEARALEAKIAVLDEQLADTEVRAPVSGYIQSLPDDLTGNVIDPGGLVLTLVPGDGALRFTGRISPRDVAFVEPDQPVRVKVDSFDFSRYGAIEARVEAISPTTTVDERGAAFYEIEIALERTHFRELSDGLVLLPGMTGEADIVTGNKTVFEYIWKPVFTNLDLALTER